jgi:hypothetical protein
MNRLLLLLFLFLASGVVAGGFLASAMALSQAEKLGDRRIEAMKKERDGPERSVAEKAPNRAAMLKAARRRQIVNLTNQLRPLYRFELMSVRTACHLTNDQLRSIRPETDAAFGEAIARLFEAQQKAAPGPVRVLSAELDYNAVIREAVFSVARRHVPAEQWAAFLEDLERREASRKQAGVEFLVATLDRDLQLTGRQRDQLAQSLSAHWDDLWYSSLELTLGGTPCVPRIPDELLKPYLSEAQQGIWSRMYKFEGPLWGVVFDQGGDAGLDDAPGAGPKPEVRARVRSNGVSNSAEKKGLSLEPRAKE